MKAKTKTFSIASIALIVGFVAGSLTGGFSASSKLGQGNISAMSKQKIVRDSAQVSNALIALMELTSRMDEFSALVDVATDASKGIPELSKPLETIQNVRRISDNAIESGKLAVDSYQASVSDFQNEKEAQCELAFQNLTIANLMVDRQITVGRRYLSAVNSYLKDKDTEDNSKLALASELWKGFCSGNALVGGRDQIEIAYWGDRNDNVSDINTFAESVR